MPTSSPKTIVEVCSSGSISHFAANRIRVRCARTTSPSSGSVSSRKSSSPRRQTTSGAITRAFAVSSSASRLGEHVVRDHPLQEVAGIRALHADTRESVYEQQAA